MARWSILSTSTVTTRDKVTRHTSHHLAEFFVLSTISCRESRGAGGFCQFKAGNIAAVACGMQK
jgi:hypothetical protein